MAASTQGGAFVHRARLFPLPFLPFACPPPCSSSHRNRVREKVKRTIVAVTNRCIFTLNRLYSPPSFTAAHPPVPLSHSHYKSQPDTSTSSAAARSSAAQLRVIGLLKDRCASFVTTARIWCSHLGSACVGVTETTAVHILDAVWEDAASAFSPPTHTKHSTDDSCSSSAGYSPLIPLSSSSPSHSSFSSSSTPVVPLIAARVSLPDSLNIVPIDRVLPPDVAVRYTAAAAPALLRPYAERFVLDLARPLRRPRIAGSRAEYVQLVRRMHAVGMLSFTSTPLAVNGVFAVGKDADTDRLIIDAQPANRLFVDSPHVALPNPSHLVQLQLPQDAPMFVAKSDLSNFYHHLGLPAWMQPYFALPPLTPTELLACGVPPGAAFPMCVTLPMGFSHAVYLAQTGHEHVLYGSGALSRDDSLLSLRSPAVSASSCIHGIVIDDLFIFVVK